MNFHDAFGFHWSSIPLQGFKTSLYKTYIFKSKGHLTKLANTIFPNKYTKTWFLNMVFILFSCYLLLFYFVDQYLILVERHKGWYDKHTFTYKPHKQMKHFQSTWSPSRSHPWSQNSFSQQNVATLDLGDYYSYESLYTFLHIYSSLKACRIVYTLITDMQLLS